MSDAQPLLSAEELSALSAAVDDGSLSVDTGYNLDAQVRKHDLTTATLELLARTRHRASQPIDQRVRSQARRDGRLDRGGGRDHGHAPSLRNGSSRRRAPAPSAARQPGPRSSTKMWLRRVTRHRPSSAPARR